ncbi:hypothetical protein MKW92_023784 [Papaver armeniacum]|nr:hypothetical protein MKW92_023784 [Papaver armeniacum]
MLGNIDLRCRDIFATDDPFGNVSIVLVGDIRQLPPVFDSPLYAQGGRDRDLELTGYAAYSVFEHCVHLKEVFRQSGIEEQQFREALLRLSDGKSTIEDWELFKSREYVKLTVQEKDHFKNAIRLFPKKEDAAAHNYEQLEKLGYPVARVMSSNNCQTAEHASTDDAKGLQKIVLLSKESRVMLRKNICTKFGLVNGSTGTVVDVVYEDGKKPPTHMPIAVMVRFDKYTGPQLYEEPNVNVIPIVPAITNWISSSGVTCQRKQFPLILCWAITVHKSQGLTLDQAVVDIGAKESLGLTFVALSRTRRLSDLAFHPMFSFERIAKIGECKALPERRQEEKRLQELSQHCGV